MVKYSVKRDTKKSQAFAKASDMRVSFKNMWNVAAAIRGRPLGEVKTYLAAVLEKSRCIPMTKFAENVGRTPQAKEFKHASAMKGRWPVKAVTIMQSLLRNLEANAVQTKVTDAPANLIIKHVQIDRAPCGRRRTYRAHGRISAYQSLPCHVQLMAEVPSESVAAAEGQKVRLTKKQLARKINAAN